MAARRPRATGLPIPLSLQEGEGGGGKRSSEGAERREWKRGETEGQKERKEGGGERRRGGGRRGRAKVFSEEVGREGVRGGGEGEGERKREAPRRVAVEDALPPPAAGLRRARASGRCRNGGAEEVVGQEVSA